MGVTREGVEQRAHVLAQQRVQLDLPAEGGQLLGGGQLTVDEQVGRLDEVGVLCKLLDGVAAVAQDPLFAVDVGDGAAHRAGVDVAGVVGDQARLRSQLADVDTPFVLGSGQHLGLEGLAVELEAGRVAHRDCPSAGGIRVGGAYRRRRPGHPGVTRR